MAFVTKFSAVIGRRKYFLRPKYVDHGTDQLQGQNDFFNSGIFQKKKIIYTCLKHFVWFLIMKLIIIVKSRVYYFAVYNSDFQHLIYT